MQINGVSSRDTTAPVISGAAAAGLPKTSATPETVSRRAPAGAGVTPVPQQSAADAVSAATALLSSPTYSVSVAGKSYPGNVSQFDGIYTISVSSVPDASVSASSLSAAQSALNVKIDTLV